ncbi:MAG: ATP-binding protein [Pirellulaceae bacterium]|nr:ATP-binding protein [Pirellulaceae bacterium]
MLIEFRVENHRSLRKEQALSLVCSERIQPEDTRPRAVNGIEQRLLPAVVIYGGNASGKSNVLAAITFMRNAVVYSHRAWNPEGGVPRNAFGWGESSNDPSMFEVTMVIEQIKYEYGFVLSDSEVDEEWLFAWPNNRKQVWFERDKHSFKFGEHLKGPNDSVKEVTRPNALYLSTAAQLGHGNLAKIFNWFQKIVPSGQIHGRQFPSNRSGVHFDLLFPFGDAQLKLFSEEEDNGLVDQIRNLFKAADLGIVDIRRADSEKQIGSRTVRQSRIQLQHQNSDDASWLDLEEESEGTKTLYRLSPLIFQVLESGGILVVDELESSLHPLLGLEILKLFNCPKLNRNNAQLIFTTHDTNLLGTTLGEPPLRRDQVWFTEKDDTGSTQLYPLTDYKPRNVENLERGYLQGRYGAIPFIGDLSWAKE